MVIRIHERLVGEDEPCFVIAEAGVNHNGDIKLARRLVEVAADAGADAVKFQTFSADRLATRDAPKAAYQQRAGESLSQHAMLKRLEIDREAHVELMEICRERGILFLSTPFDEESADLLDALQVRAFKTPSGELTNLPYLEHVARKGKPMIVSTGMANLAEVEAAVQVIFPINRDLVLLHCVSSYPAPPETVNLRAMATLARAFRTPVGYSDHTEGVEIALAAVALGACVIEKHFTLDRTMPGPDHAASLEPRELAALVTGIRRVGAARGDGVKRPSEDERRTAAVARKSIVTTRDIPAGTRITPEMLALKRPGNGLPPSLKAFVVGRTTRRDIPAGAVLSLEMLT